MANAFLSKTFCHKSTRGGLESKRFKQLFEFVIVLTTQITLTTLCKCVFEIQKALKTPKMH